ncbi:uncharacterized protein LOC123510870 [Portunus trituberculatus]|uniref:uncharacterized protein LOC123510870 n=1 Tax=Portunus trituberculatus TaxID=210409 RepID=UPI001E1CBBAA|nr:uncharacterized protein LOC123510870 [Portunus trituberculatus]
MRHAWVAVVVVAAVSGGTAVLANHDLPQQEAAQPRAARILPRPFQAEGPMNARTAGWVAAAYGMLQALKCETQRWTTERECRAAQRVPRRKMQVWATPAGRGRFVARLPDGSLARRGGHGGVVMLDPFPDASWGHPLLLLLVADNTSHTHCTRTAGHWLEPGDCLRVAVKERCHNLLRRRGSRKNYERRCEIRLPPLVMLEEGDEERLTRAEATGPRLLQRPRQYLKCRDDADGYAPCHRSRPLNDTRLVCDPLGINKKGCTGPHDTVHTRCRLFEVCDQALVLSGGWTPDLSPLSSAATVDAAYRLLRRYGFHKGNIKIFYANGATKDQYPAEGHTVFPSSFKLAFRYHLRSLCATPLCTDSLVLYLTGPSLHDGTLLLWDEDRNGLMRAGEVYSPKELLKDLRNCAARQVTVLVDTSYGGEIVNAFASSRDHHNVQVYAAAGSGEYSWGHEFSSHWLHYNHLDSCTARVHQVSRSAVRHSTPLEYDGSGGALRRNIFGAPCNVTPPYTWRELHRRYLGCQNIPTALWLHALPHHFSQLSPADITDDYHLPTSTSYSH